jgi:hypothetical protein
MLSSIRFEAFIWADDVATALRGFATFAATRLTTAFFASVAEFLAVFLFAAAFFVVLAAIVFTAVLRAILTRDQAIAGAGGRRRQKKDESPQSTPVPAAQPHASGPSPTKTWAMSAEPR